MSFETLFKSRFVSIIGCIYLAKLFAFLTYQTCSGLRTYVGSKVGPVVNFSSKYGPWAVITGSTDGLGKEFALQLAKQGLNIVLISRSEAKLEATAAEIKELYGVEVKYITADFSSTDVYDNIRKVLDNTDVGILINNVGIFEKPGHIMDRNEDFLKDIVNINILATLINTSIVIKQMKEKNRGLIINIGSQSGVFPVPYIGIYSCTKAFIDHYTAILHCELKGTNIRVKCFRGGFIKTKLLSDISVMTDFYEKYLPFALPDAKTYVESAVATLNTNVVFTGGYWSHSLFLFLAENFLSKRLQVELSKFVMSNKLIWKKNH